MFYFNFLILLLPVVKGQDGHFRGGSISFSFINDTEIEVRTLLGWTLGLGPCGPGCNKTRVGTSTSLSRAKVLQSTSPDHLGHWSSEVRTQSHVDITQAVTSGFSGRLAGVNEHLKWELESGVFNLTLDPGAPEQDIILEGNYWAPMNPLQSRKGHPNHSRYHLQIKVDSGRRNDTGKPNTSPVVLFKPEYSIQLNGVTEIKLPTMDVDGDVVYCSDARFVEAGDLDQMTNVHVEKTNCSIMINASESSGYTDDGTVAVLIKVMDYNYLPIQISTESPRVRRPFEVPLSAVPLQFLVRTIRNLQAPVFVPPTPGNNHHFEVYAGSRLDIELFAQPHQLSSESLDFISVTYIQQLNIHVSDPYSVNGKVRGQNLTWTTTDAEVGTYIIQASPVDTAGINGQERNFIITVKDVQLVDTKQDLTPMQGNFTCLLNSTCEVPVVFSPGSSVQEVLLVNSTLPGVAVSPLRMERTGYRTDVGVLGTLAGPHQICLRVTGGGNGHVVSCLTLTVIPPDPCVEEPCGLSGQCVSHWGQYSCVCHHGYTGEYCQSEIDNCVPMPCKNEAKCFTLPPSAPLQFVCKCLPPWSGTVCGIGPSTTQPSTAPATTSTITAPSSVVKPRTLTTPSGSSTTTKTPEASTTTTTQEISTLTTTLRTKIFGLFTKTTPPVPSRTTLAKLATTSTISSVTTPLKDKTTLISMTTTPITTVLTSDERPSRPPLLKYPDQRQSTRTSRERSTTIPNRIGTNNAVGRKTHDGGFLLYSDHTTVLNVQRQINVTSGSNWIMFIIISCLGGLLVGFVIGGTIIHLYKECQRFKKVFPETKGKA